jgi:nitroreductase
MPLLPLSPDELLSTTRAVRKRMDFDRPVERDVIKECLQLALQAPSGSNSQGWHFVVVTDEAKRRALGDIYRKAFDIYRTIPGNAGSLFQDDPERAPVQQRVMSSAEYLAEHIHKAPVHLVPCIGGRMDGQPPAMQAGAYGSIFPAVWSFMLAARARGLGTSWTSLHLLFEEEAAGVLGIPFGKVSQTALVPVAYTRGTDFKPGPRQPLDDVVHWDAW